jgi:hypothetical protein
MGVVCAGSYQTYAATASAPPVPQLKLPTLFFASNGSYKAAPTRRHPPAVIAQPEGDDFVPPTVATNYVHALHEANISGVYVTVAQNITINSSLVGLNTDWKHMFFPQMVTPMVELFCRSAGKLGCGSCGKFAPC